MDNKSLNNLLQSKCADLCFIIPPYILMEIEKKGTNKQKEFAKNAIEMSNKLRMARVLFQLQIKEKEIKLKKGKRRIIYDAENRWTLPGKKIRDEGEPKSKDKAVNEAYINSGKFFDFFKKQYERNSLNNKGMFLKSSVHYGVEYDNAFWNGEQMAYGDGDGEIFNRFTKCLEIVAHELSHGIIQYEANLDYQDQSGALNESFADIFGVLVKQYFKKQKAEEADWLIGKGIFTKKIKGVALRSMKEPGSAYDDPLIGKDPQPAHMKDYIDTYEDNGGVHLNSGIPNRAFYEAAIRLGGYAWEKAGRIWYIALTERLNRKSEFKDAAEATANIAKELYGTNSAEAEFVSEAWKEVGVL